MNGYLHSESAQVRSSIMYYPDYSPCRKSLRAACRSAPDSARKFLGGAALALLLGACSPTIEVRGYVPDEAVLAGVRPGVDNRQSVSDMLGTPSTVATFDTDVWYYVSTTQRREAFFDPELISRTIVAVEFDQNGNVADMRRYSLADGRIVAFVDRETPSRGRELTFLEQMFGNFGRFTGAPGGGSSGPGS